MLYRSYSRHLILRLYFVFKAKSQNSMKYNFKNRLLLIVWKSTMFAFQILAPPVMKTDTLVSGASTRTTIVYRIVGINLKVKLVTGDLEGL